MPIFTIQCNDCKAMDEVLVRGASTEPPVCGECGSANTERMVSRAAVCTVSSGGSGSAACPTGTCPFANR